MSDRHVEYKQSFIVLTVSGHFAPKRFAQSPTKNCLIADNSEDERAAKMTSSTSALWDVIQTKTDNSVSASDRNYPFEVYIK